MTPASMGEELKLVMTKPLKKIQIIDEDNI